MFNQRWFTVIDKMVFRDLSKTLVAVLSVIIVIIVSRQFLRILAKAVQGEVSNQTLLSILGLKILVASSLFLPAAFFITVLLVLGRMYRDQEMSALSAAGAGAGRMFHAVFILAIPLSVLAAGLSMYTAPWADETIERKILNDKQAADIRGIAAGRFSEFQQGDLVIYVEDFTKKNLMKNVFVQNRNQGKLGIISARSGEIKLLEGGRYFVLYDGEQLKGVPGEVDFIIEKFDEYAVRIEAKGQELSLDREAVPTLTLWDSPELRDQAELLRRFSIPFGILILGALAVPLSQISPRGGIYGSLFTAFLIYFCYANFVRISQSWVSNGYIPLWAGYSVVYISMLLIIGTLLVRQYGLAWFKLKFKQGPVW